MDVMVLFGGPKTNKHAPLTKNTCSICTAYHQYLESFCDKYILYIYYFIRTDLYIGFRCLNTYHVCIHVGIVEKDYLPRPNLRMSANIYVFLTFRHVGGWRICILQLKHYIFHPREIVGDEKRWRVLPVALRVLDPIEWPYFVVV